MIRICILLFVVPLSCLTCLTLSGCEIAEGHGPTEDQAEASHGGHHEAKQKIVVTSPLVQDVVNTQQYVCQIHSRRHIEVRALEGGYLEEIHIQEGQTISTGELMFKIQPVLYKARLDSEVAEAELARLKVTNTQRLVDSNVVSKQELALAKAELAKVQAKAELAQAELNFTDVKAPFDGIVDRQMCQQGSLIEEGDVLTTLSDNNVMWAYFNVPEARYLEYTSGPAHNADDMQIELVLANGETFPQDGSIGAIEADFNNTTGNIAFRADFDNPDKLLRHGQTGTIRIHRPMKDAIVIPQRATYEILAKQYVYVIDQDDVVRQREIEVEKELDDIYVIKSGLQKDDRIVFEGIRQVRDGDKVEFEYRDPDEILNSLKYHAE
ncbi:MAG: efflux RND transporter periplasmic adaptor subunit [Planctomycetaceae bacterium]|nr:efflux RND transporter periplasmic adaptor subunit [Planctomycetaceae bacterium]